MKNLIVILTVVLFVSCIKMSDGVDSYCSCEQLLDTTGLKLYPFAPFTDEEWRLMSYDYKLERRQIPEDFLRGMSTKTLFYQVVYTDLSKSMGVSNTMQQGFEAVTQQLNMLPELLNRPDAGHVLLELLQKVEPSKIDGLDCFWWEYCLQIILAQKEVINRMTDEDIDQYIHQQLRCHDAIQSLSKTDNPNWEYPSSAASLLFGLGNVMLRYQFEPFMQMLEMRDRHPVTNELIWDTQHISEKDALQIIDYAKQIINR